MRRYSIPKIGLIAVLLVLLGLPAYQLLVVKSSLALFLSKNLEVNLKLFSKQLLSHLLKNGEGKISAASVSREFSDQVNDFRNHFSVFKVILFDAQGQPVYTSVPGETPADVPPLAIDAELEAGKSRFELIREGQASRSGDVYATDLVEAYIPIFNTDGHFLGLFEISYNPSPKNITLSRLSMRLDILVIGSIMAILLTVIALISKERSLSRSREAAARELGRARDQWQQTLDAIGDIITIMDKDFRLVMVNQAAASFFKTTKEQLLGHYCYEVFRQQTAPCLDCSYQNELFRNGSGRGEIYYPHLDKSMLVSISAISGVEGELTGYVNVARDITDQKKMEKQLRHTQKMEAIGVLTGGVAHNFRNILAGIKASAQVIEMTFPDNEKLREIAAWIIDSVNSGSQLVTGLSQFSRLKKWRGSQVLDLNKLAQDAFRILRGSLSRQVELHLETHSLPLPIKGDAGDLLQVIINICNNANDAIKGVGLIRIKLFGTSEHAVLTISDNGPGIDEKIIDKIFEPFFTTKEVDQGTGLGLSISYGIILEHGGGISANSKPGQGATFTVTIPLVRGEEEHTQPDNLPQANKPGRRILVVDDEPGLVELTRLLLVNHGYDVAGASGCSQALQLLKEWRPQLVLMDLNMPETNGLACADAMYELDPEIRIILTSGTEIDQQVDLEARTTYILAFLVKPIGLTDLTAIISKILDSPQRHT